MKIFYEEADKELLKVCKDFIKHNANSVADYHVFVEALYLYNRLSDSLLKSQESFNRAIKEEADQVIRLEESPAKELRIIKFNQANYCLQLDVEAHSILEQLGNIEKRNRSK